ncbi:MAG TPA: ankyrin repeat domain-containing protein, partial [Thermoanaerobaculia bacterium]
AVADSTRAWGADRDTDQDTDHDTEWEDEAPRVERLSPLLRAAHEGDLAEVRRLLDAGADPNHTETLEGRWRDGVQRSALGGAARGGHLEVARLLLGRGARVDLTPRGDASPLMIAAGNRHRDLVRLLLDAGADPSRVVPGDGTPLIAAARSGDREIVRMLLAAGAEPDVYVEGDESPLYHAIESGDREMVRLLLDAGADPGQATRGRPGPGPEDGDAWLVVDAATRRLIVPSGAVVEFEGRGELSFPAGPVSVRLPAGHRLLVDGERVEGQAVITGYRTVEVAAPDGEVAWRLREASWDILERPGTRIQDTDLTRSARIDSHSSPTRFYLAVDDEGREIFFEPDA